MLLSFEETSLHKMDRRLLSKASDTEHGENQHVEASRDEVPTSTHSCERTYSRCQYNHQGNDASSQGGRLRTGGPVHISHLQHNEDQYNNSYADHDYSARHRAS